MDSKEAVRFSELKKALVDISSTMLSERLLELEQEWLVAKKSMAQRLNIAGQPAPRNLQLF